MAGTSWLILILKYLWKFQGRFKRMQMNDNPELYHNNNNLTRTQAVLALKAYAHKFQWKQSNIRILDVGSGDGSVTEILKEYIPKNYQILIGSDISENMVKFANDHYQDERSKFIKLNIEKDLPKELKEHFDHVFSFYLFHWINKPEKVLRNFYYLLEEGGEFFMTFLGYTQIYSIFIALSKTEKWGKYLQDVNKVVSPYHDCQDPDGKVYDILKQVGFRNINIRCKQTMYTFETQELKNAIAAIHSFKFPEDTMYEDFLNDYLIVAKEMRLMNEDNNTLKFNYNLIIVHCRK